MSIYKELKAAGIPLDSHESDLYVKVCPESARILQTYEHRCNISTFLSNIDQDTWYELPFAYEPYWIAKAKRNERTK